MARDLELKTGIVVTGGSFENSLIDDRQIRNLEGSVVEMEAAAVGKMSRLMGKQFMAVKALVDFDDGVGFAGQFDKSRRSGAVLEIAGMTRNQTAGARLKQQEPFGDN